MSKNEQTISAKEKLIPFLNQVFSELVGNASNGNVTFCRCLSPNVVELLASSMKFCPEGWRVCAVIQEQNESCRCITSDQAVELREEKGQAILMLIDVQRAGAGMDGIFSASRELTEEMIFNQTKAVTKRMIGRQLFDLAEQAVKQVRYIGERKSLSKWQQIEFYATVFADPGELGRAISLLGLWPIQGKAEAIQERDLQVSARIVDRLFLGSGAARTPAERVESLLLRDETPAQEVCLQQIVRDAARRPLPEVIAQISETPEIWLGNIQPEFMSQQLRKVKIRSWRNSRGTVGKWSGLEDGNPPQFLLSTDKVSRLEVRFETEPQELSKGCVEYRVSVMSGDDELAYRDISHAVRKGAQYQTVKLTTEDFEGIAEDSQFEARVVVSVIGVTDDDIYGDSENESEEFLIRYGESTTETTSNTTKFERCMVDGAVSIADVEQFDKDVSDSDCFEVNTAKNYVAFRSTSSKKSFKVQRPALIEVIERLQSEQTNLGRWSVQVREDGQRVADPIFHAFQAGNTPTTDWERVIKTAAALQKELSSRGGFWGSIYGGNYKRADDYVNSWLSVLEVAPPEVALTDTIEVQSLSAETIGLIVLPSHPMRVAWHVAYDQLLRHLRFESQSTPARIREAVAGLQASHFPSILPGLARGENFVYADTLAFFATAMVRDRDPEPKSAVAILMRSLGLNEHDPGVSSMGIQVSESLAREVSRYIQFHDLGQSSGGAVLVHALRPGDGCTVARALGTSLKSLDCSDDGPSPVRFNLEMFPAEPNSDITGNFLVDLVERHRTGAAGISDGDRWMLESQSNYGGVTLPRLRWAKKDSRLPNTSAHLAIAFDSFDTRVDFIHQSQLESSAPLHVYGLVANIQRAFTFQPSAEWLSWMPVESDGEKHPAARTLTDRIIKLNKWIMRSVCRHAGQDDSSWPVLRTSLMPEQKLMLEKVHQLSDWVITIDRNAGIEYFDAPRDEPSIYETFVIDCVPERDDLGSLQMITSTTRTDEIRELLDEMLEQMSLSASRRNCEFLVRHLKALSGRLAMRLTNLGSTSCELIALALVHSHCENASDNSTYWMSLRKGFFVPVDDIPDLAPKERPMSGSEAAAEPAPKVRSDLIYVSLPARGGLSFTFAEVKYRRNLRAARSPELIQLIDDQTQLHREAWMNWYFDGKVPEPLLALRRSRLVRALRFYLDKARRHYLDSSQYERFKQQLDRLMTDGRNYKFSEPAIANRGYIFCPEFTNSDPVRISDASAQTTTVLFGATTMPDLAAGVERTPGPIEPPNQPAMDANDGELGQITIDPDGTGKDATDESKALIAGNDLVSAGSQKAEPNTAIVRFGLDQSNDEPVNWTVSSSANPHLMIVGFPGMGKTEAVMNICQQLMANAITPIVFSYHPDIDDRLSKRLADVQLLDHQRLGFNPMHLDAVTRTAHVDSAGMLRDVFAAMFSDLGDIQLERLRSAIRETYVRHGWGGDSESPSIPEFREFYTLLKNDPKPEKNLLARLDELDDYGIFSNSGDVRSLLASSTPLVLKIHATQNEMVQRAVAMLALFNVYKEMFRRGVQDRITHAVIFDEAHRASKMKLLPKLAAECRKFGIALILASQSAKDFDTALYSNVASYLLLRMTDQDAVVLSKNITTSDQAKRTADRMKQLQKYHALFFREGVRNPTHVKLDPPS